MTATRERLGRYITALAATGTVFLAGAAATGAAQSHGGGAMGGWGVGGWLFWPLLVVGLLAFAVVWAASREGSSTARARTGESDPALEALRERYARGDISDEEFERRRRTLHTRG